MVKRIFALVCLFGLIFVLGTGLVSAQTLQSIQPGDSLSLRDMGMTIPGFPVNISENQLLELSATTFVASAGDWIVDTLADDDDGECVTDCTLREAVGLAASGDTIAFDDSIVPGTITFVGDPGEDLKIVIDKNLIIDNSNHVDKITISGNDTSRIFHVEYGIEFTLKNLSLEDGRTMGGAINNEGGIVTIFDCVFRNNGISITSGGGALYNSSTLNSKFIIHRSQFLNNLANKGGAIYNARQMEIYDSYFENNSANNYGGAIYNSPSWATYMYLILDGCTFSGNSVTNFDGGAICNESDGTLTATNCTFYNNSATNGGAIYGHTGVDQLIINSTFSDNTATTGAGGLHTGGLLRLYNSILANSNTGAVDCFINNIETEWIYNNLIENNSEGSTACGTPLLTDDPALGPLQDNGGNTLTMALSASSPALNVGASGTDPNGIPFCTTTDQRGVERPQGSGCDLGAFELTVAPQVLSIVRANSSPTSDYYVNFTVTFSNNVDGVDIGDFSLDTTGVSGESISALGGSGSVYTVTIYTGTGIGTIRLDLEDDDSINAAGEPLGGAGVGNGDFIDGEIYIIDSPPAFIGHPVTGVNVGELYTYEIKTTDPDITLPGETLTISSRSLPTWLTLTDIDSENGTATLTGTPTSKQWGPYDITLLVRDSLNLSDTLRFTITVNRYPSFSSSPVLFATVGETYSYAVSTSDKDGDDLTITAPTKPGWLILNDYEDGTALLTGNPGSNGDYPVTLRVSDGHATADQSFTIHATENHTPTFTSSAVTSGVVGVLYEYDITTSDQDGDSMDITTTEKPTWLTLIDDEDGTALLTGAPPSDGDYNVTLRVSDGDAYSDQSFTIHVTENHAPTFTSAAVTSGIVGVVYEYDITTSDQDGDSRVITAPTEPIWLTLTDNGDGTAKLTGTPNSAGDYNVTLRVSDGETYSEQSFSINVTEDLLMNFLPLFIH